MAHRKDAEDAKKINLSLSAEPQALRAYAAEGGQKGKYCDFLISMRYVKTTDINGLTYLKMLGLKLGILLHLN